MEALLVLGLFAGIALVGFFNRRELIDRGRRAEHIEESARTPDPSPPPFDETTAQQVVETVRLSGPAYVIDGDSLVICRTQVRLFGVDAPEINHPYGKKAKWALHGLCKDRLVRAEVTERDAYGRTVARCFLPDGRDLSAEMVRLGLALDWAKFSGGVYRHMETPEARRKLWLADARQKGRMHVWEKFDARERARSAGR